MQDIVQDPLARLIAARMEEAIANGADVPELAALTIDAVLAECVAILEVCAVQHRDESARLIIQDCADALLSVQFSGPTPAPVRR